MTLYPDNNEHPPRADAEPEPNLWFRIEWIEAILCDARTSGLEDVPDDHAPRDRAIRDALYAFAEDEYVRKLLADVRKATREWRRRIRA